MGLPSRLRALARTIVICVSRVSEELHTAVHTELLRRHVHEDSRKEAQHDLSRASLSLLAAIANREESVG